MREKIERERGSCRKKSWEPTTSIQSDTQKRHVCFLFGNANMSLCFVYDGGGSGLGPSEDASQRESERGSERGSERERERASARESKREVEEEQQT